MVMMMIIDPADEIKVNIHLKSAESSHYKLNIILYNKILCKI